MKNEILIISVIVLFSSLIIVTKFHGNRVPQNQNSVLPTVSQKPKVLIGETQIYVELADTFETRQRGLSGRESLGENEGMLFLFDSNTHQDFWMKDMLIPLDIIWIKDAEIVHIDENVPPPEPNTPDYNLPRYSPPTAINKVLEVNAGFSDMNGIEVGDTVDFSGI